MRKTIKNIASMYIESFTEMRKDLPQIALCLSWLIGIAAISMSYILWGKAGGAGSALFYFAAKAWFKNLKGE